MKSISHYDVKHSLPFDNAFIHYCIWIGYFKYNHCNAMIMLTLGQSRAMSVHYKFFLDGLFALPSSYCICFLQPVSWKQYNSPKAMQINHFTYKWSIDLTLLDHLHIINFMRCYSNQLLKFEKLSHLKPLRYASLTMGRNKLHLPIQLWQESSQHIRHRFFYR